MDLIAQLPDIDPATVWDLGCGTGAITRMLAARWADAAVTGLDTSAEMLENARRDPSTVAWVQGDIAEWSPPGPVDLIFANASLHWVDDHDALFPRLANALAPGGVLAVQMPRNADEPSHRVLSGIALGPRWSDRVGHLAGGRPVDTPSTYFDRLSPVCREVNLWETMYLHVLQGDDAAAEWVKGAAARPFLEELGDDGDAFFAEYTAALRPSYPTRTDGSTLFPFRRVFVIATR